MDNGPSPSTIIGWVVVAIFLLLLVWLALTLFDDADAAALYAQPIAGVI